MILAAFNDEILEDVRLICINLPKKFDFFCITRKRVVADFHLDISCIENVRNEINPHIF